MESPEALQRRMENLTDLQQIVRTMKALSAVSIRQYERAAQTLAEYERTVQLGLQAVLRETATPVAARRSGGNGADADASSGPAPGAGADSGADSGADFGAVVFGTDHGLCGRFNEVIAEHVVERHRGVADRRGQRWLAVGERVAPALERSLAGELRVFPAPSSAGAITGLVQRVLLEVDRWRADGVGRIELYHNRPTGRSGYEPHGQLLFPIDPDAFRPRSGLPWPSRRLPQFTMDRGRLLGSLLRQRYFVLLFRACAESLSAEHASRLAAMQAAEKNVDERLEEVTGRFRRVRQAHITSELLDVVAGFEAAS
ncbi:MAG: F0F1 ATP synthase subunit gamma [Thiohalocapsa sp.]|nr:F0F1 ATP synthase subunit gamma [Thiohalocapsa sp.]